MARNAPLGGNIFLLILFFVAGILVQRAMGQDTITRMKLCSLKRPQHHIAPSIQRTGRSFCRHREPLATAAIDIR
ncbi:MULTISPECIES: hypothetical protein [unclassified Ensifer]|uniref:hypothetical protein n=1 Tax=unclassified Ensifer TaxID=2633371 RepID=UPI000B123684|nr:MULTISPECIES: hypothetical protein [unclassified Ensifer]